MYKALGLATVLMTGLCGGAPVAAPQDVSTIDPEVLSVLPEGMGREATARVCTQCHSIGLVISQKHDQAGWNEVIGRMIQSQGLEAPEDELVEISAYLTQHYGPRTDPAPVS